MSVKAQGAFTLMELLVVVAVIAILAAIFLPILNRAGRCVQTAECLNNMKQLQRCYCIYVEENNGWLPWNAVAGLGKSWITNNDDQVTVLFDGIKNGVLYPYDRDIKIYQCPANLRTIQVPNGTEALQARKEYGEPGINTTTFLPQTRTCSVNYPLGGYTGADTSPGATLATGVHALNKYSQMIGLNPTPAKMIGFCDENEWGVDDGDFAIIPAGSNDNTWWNAPGSRHNRGTTWSFCDGHCEYWRWHGSAVPNLENNQRPSLSPADSSDDLARVQSCTCPFGN